MILRNQIVLRAGLALATLGMVCVVLGVVSPGLFFPGVYLLAAALLALAVAGVLQLLDGRKPA
ncbi:MAG: hypothetical protein ACT443_07770 [Gemmatimonadota bacterium]